MPTQVQGLGLVDDQGNKSIVVNLSNTRQMTNAEYQQLTPVQRNGAIIVTDFPIPENEDYVEVEADGVKTYSALLDELYALIDADKIKRDSVLCFKSSTSEQNLRLTTITSTKYIFGSAQDGGTSGIVGCLTATLTSSASRYQWTQEKQTSPYNSVNDSSAIVPTSDTKLTLYYGTSSEIMNLLTDADHCMMSDGVTSVEDELNGKVSKSGDTIKGILSVDRQNGTTSTVGYSLINVGNILPEGTDKNTQGLIDVFGTTQYRSRIKAGALTGYREAILPDKSGTLALVSDTTQYVDYEIASQTYTNGEYKTVEGGKTSFGLPQSAKIMNITVLGNNGGLLCAGINDYEGINWLRFRIYNIAGTDKTQALPVRIWYKA